MGTQKGARGTATDPLGLSKFTAAVDPRATSRIPAHLLDSLQRYASDQRVQTGKFLRAVLENDLSLACSQADMDNVHIIPAIACYIYNELPSLCWGSRAKVERWLRRAEDVPPIDEAEHRGGEHMKLPPRMQAFLRAGRLRLVTKTAGPMVEAYLEAPPGWGGVFGDRVLVSTLARDAVSDQVLFDDWKTALVIWLERLVESAEKAS